MGNYMNLLKKALLVVSLFLVCYSMYGEEKTLQYLRSDYFLPFKYDNKSDSISISKLMSLEISDTININKSLLWYDENTLDSIWMHRSYQANHSEKFTSFKLLSYYWIILILKKEEYDSNNICIFYNKYNRPIFDYKFVGYRETNPKSVFDNQFLIKDLESVKILETKFNKWFKLFNTLGLEYLMENKIYPLEQNDFLILEVTWFDRN